MSFFTNRGKEASPEINVEWMVWWHICPSSQRIMSLPHRSIYLMLTGLDLSLSVSDKNLKDGIVDRWERILLEGDLSYSASGAALNLRTPVHHLRSIN